MTIHWCGTGLSAIPGLRALIEDGLDVKFGTEPHPRRKRPLAI